MPVTKITRNCETCGKAFDAVLSQVRRGLSRFCSRICSYAPRLSSEDRFLSKVGPITDTGCMLWQGGCYSSGYGQFWADGKSHRAHQFAWSMANDRAVPDGMCILHKCDNPPCVNPDHLILGTCQDNSDDKVSKDRHTYGEQTNTAKLTDDAVRSIRASYAAGGTSHAKLAAQHGVTKRAITSVINGVTWKHVV